MIGLEEIYQMFPGNKFLLERFLLYLDPLELIKMVWTCKYFKQRKRLIYNIITPVVYDIMRQSSYIDAYSYYHYKMSLKTFNAFITMYLPFKTYDEYIKVMSNIINYNKIIRKRFKIKQNQKVMIQGI